MIYRRIHDEFGCEIAVFRIEGKFIRIKIGNEIKTIPRRLVIELAQILGIDEKEALVEVCKLIRDYSKKS